MKRFILLFVAILVPVVLLLTFRHQSPKKLQDAAAAREISQSLSALFRIIEDYSYVEPAKAITLLEKRSIDLSDKTLQQELISRSTNAVTEPVTDPFHDIWGGVLHIKVLTVETNVKSSRVEARIKLWSSGINHIDDGGMRDDMVYGPIVVLIPIR